MNFLWRPLKITQMTFYRYERRCHLTCKALRNEMCWSARYYIFSKQQVLTNHPQRSQDGLNVSTLTSSLYRCCGDVKDIFVKLLFVQSSKDVGNIPLTWSQNTNKLPLYSIQPDPGWSDHDLAGIIGAQLSPRCVRVSGGA